MDHSTHNDHGQASDPRADHKMSDIHGIHDRHGGHSVAMFRDKFWLSFALCLAKTLSLFDFNRMRRCVPQSECDSTIA